MIQESFSAPDRHQLVRTITFWIGLSVKLATLRNRTLELQREYDGQLNDVRKLLYACCGNPGTV